MPWLFFWGTLPAGDWQDIVFEIPDTNEITLKGKNYPNTEELGCSSVSAIILEIITGMSKF